jgi:hypothetical protein
MLDAPALKTKTSLNFYRISSGALTPRIAKAAARTRITEVANAIRAIVKSLLISLTNRK